MTSINNTLLYMENINLIRGILFPFINIKRSLKKYYYKYTLSAQILETYKNSHTGERCFIIGNGPSLTVKDLEMLKGEFCFAFNRIFEIFDITSWRPSIYICVDKHILKDSLPYISSFNFPTFLSENAQKYYIDKNNKNVVYIQNYVPFKVHRYSTSKKIKFSKNAIKCIYGGATVTYTAMQLAAFMGFKEIYLLGMDHTYSKTIDSQGNLRIDNSIRDYFGRIKTMPYTIQAIETVESAYASALEYFTKNNIKIFNSTRGGKLEIFPRICLEKVL